MFRVKYKDSDDKIHEIKNAYAIRFHTIEFKDHTEHHAIVFRNEKQGTRTVQVTVEIDANNLIGIHDNHIDGFVRELLG